MDFKQIAVRILSPLSFILLVFDTVVFAALIKKTPDPLFWEAVGLKMYTRVYIMVVFLVFFAAYASLFLAYRLKVLYRIYFIPPKEEKNLYEASQLCLMVLRILLSCVAFFLMYTCYIRMLNKPGGIYFLCGVGLSALTAALFVVYRIVFKRILKNKLYLEENKQEGS